MLKTGLQQRNPNAELPHVLFSLPFHILNQNKLYFLTSMFMNIEMYLHVSLRTCNIKFRQSPPSGSRVQACGRTRSHAISLTCICFSTSCKQCTMTYQDDFRWVFIDYSRVGEWFGDHPQHALGRMIYLIFTTIYQLNVTSTPDDKRWVG